MTVAAASNGKKHFKAVVYVSFKDGVLDPQGSTIKRALGTLGYNGIADVRAGKFFEIALLAKDERAAQTEIEEICRKLLANPVIEKYRYEVRS